MPQAETRAVGPRAERIPLLPRLDYRDLYDGLPQAVIGVDCQRRITAFNREAERLTGHCRDAALGRPCREVLRSARCNRDCPLDPVFRSCKGCRDEETSLTDAHGRRLPVIVSIGVLRDAAGSVRGAVETFRKAAPPERRRTPLGAAVSPSGFIGESHAMQRVFAMLPDIAASGAAVLISGETGTGKDLLARTLHRMSGLRDEPFVPVNCSALSESLLESELFGHEKGAFTGAERAKPGRFERAGCGTLFLDEIGELKSHLQVKLLRVLEQRSFERVGGSRSIPFRARIVSATNRDLKRALEQGRFREDLFYRLQTIRLHLPALRERPGDIAPLVRHFIERFNRRYGKSVRTLDPKVMRRFQRYHWPGNVRELERCMEHAFVFAKGPVIFASHLPDMADFGASAPKGAEGVRPPGTAKEKGPLLWALAQSNGRRAEAAALLGISRTSLWRRMREHGLA